MMKNVFLLAALSLCLFQSCDNDDNEPVPGYVSAETKAAFDEKYPSAKDVEWETRNDYLIVDFKQDKVEKEEYQKEPLIQTAYEICRWHHERYDGNGYPFCTASRCGEDGFPAKRLFDLESGRCGYDRTPGCRDCLCDRSGARQ